MMFLNKVINYYILPAKAVCAVWPSNAKVAKQSHSEGLKPKAKFWRFPRQRIVDCCCDNVWVMIFQVEPSASCTLHRKTMNGNNKRWKLDSQTIHLAENLCTSWLWPPIGFHRWPLGQAAAGTHRQGVFVKGHGTSAKLNYSYFQELPNSPWI